jgi:hypothetical protein
VVLTPRGRYRANALGTGLPLKGNGGGSRGCMWADVDMQFEMVGGQDAKIGWGWACQTNNRVRRDLYWSGAEVVVKDRLQSP